MCDMRKVFVTLRENKELKELMEKGVRYYRTLHSRDTEDGALYSWQKTFPSATCAEIEAKLGELGYTTEWTDQEALRLIFMTKVLESFTYLQVLLSNVCSAQAPNHRGGGLVQPGLGLPRLLLPSPSQPHRQRSKARPLSHRAC